MAGDQEGVFARRQVLRLGVTGKAVEHVLSTGRWYPLHHGVYSVVPPELLSEDGLLIAAMLAVGDCALLSGGTAAWRFKLIPAPPIGIELMTPHRHPSPADVTLTRCTTLRPADLTRNGRFRTTTPARTLLDLAVRYERIPLLRALEQGEFEHDLRPEDVLAVLRRGVDCAWPDRKVAVELDGRQHDRPHQRAVDSDRDIWLRSHGWVVLRYSWRQVTRRPDVVVADLLAALAR